MRTFNSIMLISNEGKLNSDSIE